MRGPQREEVFLRKLIGHASCANGGADLGVCESAELALECFRAAAHLMLARYFGHAASVAAAVYDAGMAIGFYGDASAIATGLGTAANAGVEEGGVPEHLSGTLQIVLDAGRCHGRCVKEWGRFGG
ncbi:hypothetical protein KDW69_21070 [Burkholderia ambifaria]|uniref:hypothetical protein n=1 Tax=Burkholderia ambifaria TaxID=152480 RepID=UPI001B9C6DC1|nr:hypothetical protein [Burkholderia ambifaria]MBR8334149.1 hypothetical protein [Burkholderia ambifaria]